MKINAFPQLFQSQLVEAENFKKVMTNFDSDGKIVYHHDKVWFNGGWKVGWRMNILSDILSKDGHLKLNSVLSNTSTHFQYKARKVCCLCKEIGS